MPARWRARAITRRLTVIGCDSDRHGPADAGRRAGRDRAVRCAADRPRRVRVTATAGTSTSTTRRRAAVALDERARDAPGARPAGTPLTLHAGRRAADGQLFEAVASSESARADASSPSRRCRRAFSLQTSDSRGARRRRPRATITIETDQIFMPAERAAAAAAIAVISACACIHCRAHAGFLARHSSELPNGLSKRRSQQAFEQAGRRSAAR